MKDWRSQVHVRWGCLCRTAIVPEVFSEEQRERIGSIPRQLCRQEEVRPERLERSDDASCKFFSISTEEPQVSSISGRLDRRKPQR